MIAKARVALLRRVAVPASALLILACAELHEPAVGPIVTVRVSPDTLVLRVGDTLTVTAIAQDSLDTFRSEKVATWSSSEPAVASVDTGGHVVALSAGVGTIDGTVDGVVGHAVLAVTTAPTALAIHDGNGQSAAVNSAVALPPAVRVTDAAGNPVARVTIAFAVTGGGGSVTPATAQTDFNGIASAAWTLGPSPVANTLSATIGDSGVTVAPVNFAATATVGAPDAATSSVAANPASIVPSNGQSFSTITVTVRDAAGSTITGATVTLSASGTGNLVTQPTDTTNALGQTSGAISSNVAEDKVITATVNGSVIVTQTATVTVTTSVPAGLAVTTQPAGAASNHAFTTQPVVDIRDGFGNRVMTATDPVTVSLLSGNGTLIGTTTVSAVQGRATFSGLTIRGTRAGGDTLGTGTHVLQFSAPGYAAVQADPLPVGVSFAYNLLNDVFIRNGCTGCHSFTYANLVNAATTLSCAGSTRVIASDTTNSALYFKVKSATPSCGAVMPTSGLMSLTQIQLIRDWIRQGAPNN